jgi:hypothetical protein
MPPPTRANPETRPMPSPAGPKSAVWCFGK